ncbi:glycoside hydrolase family 30 protein [Bifidobacterium biavatii]|uniref:Glucan endo-1,6-beta-glucosidase n=1 Tax=Bifidobacterium biavatii DSM 23969 TaxID=1437608 RepID=A0A086ZSF7_9BIFI|nr:glycoside hydrolase family 30 beta sandwich domain-containing protein [Bifidobacterium biavatii]KFI49457.1 glucan endo-1,6-beta-glucosidase [Bifidobacterium biavatii DSM 23969]
MNTIYMTDGPERMFTPIEEDAAGAADVTITVDPGHRHQSIDGFGASFTDASAHLIGQVLDDGDRTYAMSKLFDPKLGIGLSLLRNPMGASDYARTIYSYDDMPNGYEDMELEHFSIYHDEDGIIPLTKWAMELNPQLKLIASPWSAPGWMKTSGSMIGGELKEDRYEVYARYFVRFLQAYAEQGVPVFAVTPQNEPLFMPGHYPGMLMPADREVRFVRDFLRPALRKAGFDTRVFGYDHNWDRIDYPLNLLDDAFDAFDGIAWHWYGGRPVSQSRVAAIFPDKDVYFTEGSGGEWIPEFEPAFSNLMRTGIDILRNGSKSFILWNLALDEHNGPVVPGFGRSTCRGLLRVDQTDRTVEYTLDYYGLAHFSKFIRPGAVRIDSSQTVGVRSLACRNTDGSTVAVLFNDADHAVRVVVEVCGMDGSPCTATMPAKAALTVVWNDENNGMR